MVMKWLPFLQPAQRALLPFALLFLVTQQFLFCTTEAMTSRTTPLRPSTGEEGDDSTAGTSAVYGCNQKKLPLPRALSDPPIIAWPTLLLATCALSWYVVTHLRVLQGNLAYHWALPQWILAAYMCFTPAHDATHDAIASSRSGRARVLNGITGRLCGLTLCAPFYAFRYLHLQHHKYTNVAGKDPDLWSSMPPTMVRHPYLVPLVMPLKWASQIFSYLGHYCAHRNERPISERLETFIMALVQVIYPLFSLLVFGLESTSFWCYLFPGMVAIACLAFSFDYLPHRPHGTTDIYQGTNLTALSVTRNAKTGDVLSYVTTPLSLLMLFQNYHVIHHLYPWLPFYRYSKVWYALEDQLKQAHVPVVPVFPIIVDQGRRSA